MHCVLAKFILFMVLALITLAHFVQPCFMYSAVALELKSLLQLPLYILTLLWVVLLLLLVPVVLMAAQGGSSCSGTPPPSVQQRQQTP
jgi:hypothetical protein